MRSKFSLKKINGCRRCGAAGQSLVEVLVALFILSIGVLPALPLAIDSGRISTQSHLRSAAYSAAREQLESLRAASFDSRTNSTNAPIVGTFDIPAAIQDQYPQAAMKGNYIVAPLSNTLQQVTVQVSWYNPTATYHQTSRLRLDTMIAKEPGQ